MSSPVDPSTVMLDRILGYCRSQSLAIVGRLGVPDLLEGGPRTVDDLARECGADASSLLRMMRALAVDGIFEHREERTFAQNEMSRTLTTDHPQSVRWFAAAMCDYAHWQSWGRSYDAVREGKSQTRAVLGMTHWEYFAEHPEEADRFGKAMSNMSGQATAAIQEHYDFGGLSTIVDVGGSRGALVLELLENYPGLRATIFDLPEVAEATRTALVGHPHEDRVTVEAGSFFESVPAGHDAYVLKHILHDWPDEKCREILRRIRESIPPTGRVLVFDALLVPEAPPWAHWLDVHMLVQLDGKERSPAEFAELFASTGFEMTKAVPIPSPVAIIEARPV